MRIEDGCGFFDINIIGNKTNQTYMGNFKVKCLLSPIEQIKADKLYRDLLGDNAHLASNHVAQLVYALSQLHIRVLEAPPFWNNKDMGGGHLDDENVILEVLDSAIEAQTVFIKEKKDEMEKRQKQLADMIRGKQIVPEIEEEQAAIKEKEETEEDE